MLNVTAEIAEYDDNAKKSNVIINNRTDCQSYTKKMQFSFKITFIVTKLLLVSQCH